MFHSAKSLTEYQKNPTASTSVMSLMEDQDVTTVPTSAKSAYRNNWISENLDRVNLTMPKGKKEEIRAAAEKMGLSVNAYINLAIDEKMNNSHR